MLVAILAGVATLVITILAIVLFIRRANTTQKDHLKSKHPINQVGTVGVAPKKQRAETFSSTSAGQLPREVQYAGSPGEALRERFIAMGILSMAVFGALSAKLWSMQILGAQEYGRKAEENLYTTVYTPAPRGVIYDASGIPLVKNRSSHTVLASPDVAQDHDVIMRLSALLGIPYEVVRQRIMDASSGAQNNRVVTTDASRRNLAFIIEHSGAFKGVTTELRTERVYPFGTLAAHVLGYTGTVSDEELATATEGRQIQSGDVVGKSGVEASYDDVLAGDHGTRTLLTDAAGAVQEVVSVTDPTSGNDVYLTLRAPVQQVADDTLRAYVTEGTCTASAVVCMDCRDGSIVAMANYPTYAPESFVGGISAQVWEEFNTEESHYPLMNRSIAGTYPAASTFKAFTAMAALTDGIANAGSSYHCTGTWTGFGEAYPQKCWLLTGHGDLDLIGGIANSCDTVFYEIAKGFFDRRRDLGLDAMQNYVRQYGFGARTGIDLSGEAEGRIPTADWKAEYFKDAPEEGEWQGGDMSNMVIGQGYVLVTPLQIACGYCGIATGTIYKPHVLKEVRNSLGEVVLEHKAEVLATPTQSPNNLDLVQEGLRQVMTLNDYTRFFDGVDYTVAGKTGTAEVQGKEDYSLFACYAPANDPRYVVAIICEEGPATVTSAIPMAAEVLKAAMAYDNGELTDTLRAQDGTIYAGEDASEADKLAAERSKSDSAVNGSGVYGDAGSTLSVYSYTGNFGTYDEGSQNRR